MKKNLNKILFISLIILIGLEVLLGSVDISIGKALNMPDSIDSSILFTSRIPRLLLGILVGIACSLSGVGIQTIFKNPLAGPTTLGINSGASLGIAVFFLIPSISNDYQIFGMAGFAILGALLFLLLLLTTAGKFVNLSLVLIIGLLLSYASFAVIEVMIQLSDAEQIKNYVFWGMGSLNRANWIEILVLFSYSIFATQYVFKKSEWLNVYLLGSNELKLLGNKSIKSEKKKLLVLLGVWIGVVTAIAGPIAFVGVIVPNCLKLVLRTSDMKRLIPSSILLGAAVVLLSDLLARGVLFDFVLPINSVLSILGVPIIIYLLLKRMSFASRK